MIAYFVWYVIFNKLLQAKKEEQEALEPVDPKLWVRDVDVVACMRCRDLFNMFNRRHHCRHCGHVTCAACAPYYCYMKQYRRRERTCIQCHDKYYKVSIFPDRSGSHLVLGFQCRILQELSNWGRVRGMAVTQAYIASGVRGWVGLIGH